MTTSSSSSPTPTGTCLHCNLPSDKVQVSCEGCHGFICVDCHWCHEFQANHEIRVCDRCEKLLCTDCEDMDQCNDCGEVSCHNCGVLASCKFCGSSLCGDCATHCAKCGIVLCGRDAKFAVECDSCKTHYCLVCLASGQKETCIRCHRRPSKKMEQLVHLRLKSIYKAFQQSARTNDSNPHLKRAALAAVKKPPEIDPIVAKAQADAAAAELLAELEQEEEAAEQSKANASKNKRKKKRKKKGDYNRGAKDLNNSKPEASNGNNQFARKQDQPDGVKEKNKKDPPSTCTKTESESESTRASAAKDPPKPQKPADTHRSENESNCVQSEEEKTEEKARAEALSRLCGLVNNSDIEGIEKLLEEWKGIPGKSLLRKNAKKALKRLKGERANTEGRRGLLKIISTNLKTGSTIEVVMEMWPSIVGWVIGKGGQKIRDLMDESGAKVWIDQETMKPHEPRIVYVSGEKESVDSAVSKIKESVKQAGSDASIAAAMSASGTEPTAVTENHFSSSTDGGDVGGGENPSNLVKYELTCEARFVPLLIGKRGWTIKNIQDESGAKVDIDQTVTPRLITITGSPGSVQTAVKLVGDVLSYPQTQLKSEQDDFAEDEEPETDRGDSHSPPPSSLVVTSDIKSVISASSSLSSTPEPSMASSKGRSEPMIPPPGLYDYRRTSTPEMHGHVQRFNQMYGKPPMYQQQGFAGQPQMAPMRPGPAHMPMPMQGGIGPRIIPLPNGVGFHPHMHQPLPHGAMHQHMAHQPIQTTPLMAMHHQQRVMPPQGMLSPQPTTPNAAFGMLSHSRQHLPSQHQSFAEGNMMNEQSTLFKAGQELLCGRNQNFKTSSDVDIMASLGLDLDHPQPTRSNFGNVCHDQKVRQRSLKQSVASQEESNLVDSMFANDNDALFLSGIKGFSLGDESLVASAWSALGPNEQDKKETTHSRFVWDL